MTIWTQLISQVTVAQKRPIVFSKNIAPDIQEALKLFDQFFLSTLKKFLALSVADDEKRIRLRRLLWMRGIAIHHTSLNYTFHPMLPSHAVCLAVAQAIREKDEPIIKITMPLIMDIIGTALPKETVFLDVENEGCFLPTEFLMHSEGKKLIVISDLFEMAQIDPSILFLEKKENENSLYDFSTKLTILDYKRLREVAGQASADYLDLIETLYFSKKNIRHSIRYALKLLSGSLLKGSEVGDGADWQANASCLEPIVDFYDIWTALPVDVKNRIGNYRSKNNSRSEDCLESQLLVLFFGAGKKLTQEELARVKKENVLDCVFQIGNLIDSIVNNHPDLDDIPIPGKESHFTSMILPSSDELDDALLRVKAALVNRSSLPGDDDPSILRIYPIFSALVSSCFNPNELGREIQKIQKEVKTPVELALTLQFSPIKQWPNFFSLLNIRNIIASDRKAWDGILHVLNCLPIAQWRFFCDQLSEVNHHQFVSGFDLISLLEHISVSHYDDLKSALRSLARSVFDCADSLFSFLDFVLCFQKEKYYWVVEEGIQDAFSKPEKFILFLKKVPIVNWPEFIFILKDSLINHFNKTDYFDFVLNHRELVGSRRWHFFNAMTPVFKETTWALPQLKKIIRIFLKNNFSSYLLLMEKGVFIRMIKNLSDLRETLSLFSGEQEALRIAFVSELFSRTQTDLFEVDLKSFYELVEQFPSCQSVLISVFKKEIVRNLHLAAGFFLNALKYGAKLPENFRIHLRFFLQNALPVLLSNKHLQSICGDYFEYMDKQVRERLDQTEQLIDERRCTVISGVFEKLKIIHDFLKREINAAYAGSSSKMCAIQLNDYFGTYFFGDLVKLESVGFNSAHEDPFLPKETGLVSVNAQLPVTRSQTPSVSQRGRSPSSTHFFTQRVIRGVPQRITSAEYTRRR